MENYQLLDEYLISPVKDKSRTEHVLDNLLQFNSKPENIPETLKEINEKIGNSLTPLEEQLNTLYKQIKEKIPTVNQHQHIQNDLENHKSDLIKTFHDFRSVNNTIPEVRRAKLKEREENKNIKRENKIIRDEKRKLIENIQSSLRITIKDIINTGNPSEEGDLNMDRDEFLNKILRDVEGQLDSANVECIEFDDRLIIERLKEIKSNIEKRAGHWDEEEAKVQSEIKSEVERKIVLNETRIKQVSENKEIKELENKLKEAKAELTKNSKELKTRKSTLEVLKSEIESEGKSRQEEASKSHRWELIQIFFLLFLMSLSVLYNIFN